ncbi:MAG: ATP-grasp domain-containing protein [Vicinamibacterales bacterium]
MSSTVHSLAVLVMAVGSPLGQSIYKALRMSGLSLRLFRADISETAAGFHMDDAATNVVLPPVADTRYSAALRACVRTHGIQAVFPVITPEHAFFEREREMYESQGVRIISPASGVYQLCNDKWGSMMRLRERGLLVPDTWLCEGPTRTAVAGMTFPVIVKPRSGASSANVFLIRSLSELNGLLAAFPTQEFVAQQYLPSEPEYTVGVYLSRDGGYADTCVIRRELKFGLSYRGQVVRDETISTYSVDVCRALGLHHSGNVQLRMLDGRPCAFEVNPRLSSTTSVRAHFGFNEPEMILRELFGLPAVAPRKSTGRFMRYWQESYLPDA